MKWIIISLIVIALFLPIVYADDIELKDFLVRPGENVTGYFNFTEKIGNTVDIKFKQYDDDREAMLWLQTTREEKIVNGKVGLAYVLEIPPKADIGSYYLIIAVTDNAGTDNYKVHIQVERWWVKFLYSHILFIGILIISGFLGVAIWLFNDVTKKT